MSTISVTEGRVFERLQALKARRRGQKGVLTRRVKELRASTDNTVNSVKQKLQSVEEAYGKVLEIQGVIDKLVIHEEEAQEQIAYLEGLHTEMQLIRREAAKKTQALKDKPEVQNDQEKDDNGQPDEDAKKDDEIIGDIGNASEDDEIDPGDSASQAGRSHTSLRSHASRASVKAASLAMQAEVLQERQELEFEELRIKQRKEALQLRLDLAEAEAEASVDDLESGVPVRRPVWRPAPSVVLQEAKRSVVARTKPQPARERIQQILINDVKVDDMKVNDKETLGGLVDVVKQGQQAMIDIVQIPKFGMVKFSGDPLKYHLFINAFDSKIGCSSADDITKLMLLHENCQQKPKELVENCIGLGPDKGYARARELLKQRYGDDYTVSQAWVKKVTAGSFLGPKDYGKLLEFSDDLSTCVNTLTSMGYLAEVSTQQVMLSIASKLPSYLRTRWVKDAQTRRRNGKTPPGICELASFVASAAQEVNDPLYGTLLPGAGEVSENKHDKRSIRSKGTSFSTTVQTNSEVKTAPQLRKCSLCNAEHNLFGCDKFKTMKVFERRNYASDKKLCFNCLRPGHGAIDCRLTRTCGIEGCNQKHTKFLHPVGHRSEPAQSGGSSSVASCNAATCSSARVALPIVAVRVRAPGGGPEFETYALLDNGSTTTFCTEELAEKVGVDGEGATLIINTLDRPGRQIATRSVALEITSFGGQEFSEMSSVFTRSAIPCSTSHVPLCSDISSFAHLRDVDLPAVNTDQVTVLIGQDNADLMTPLEVRRGSKQRMPYAVKTVLGWVINGALGTGYGDTYVNFVDCGLEEQLQRFWKVEGWEGLNGPETSMSVEDQATKNLWQDTISQNDDGHYELPIPFRGVPNLPDSYPLAKRRLLSLRKRLQGDFVLKGEYVDGIEALLNKGYAEQVDVTEPEVGPLWYIPHHPVVSPKKVRMVFDCAAQVNGMSLNKCVMQGPDMTNDLVGVLHRFRLGPIAVQGDIEAMFHQVKVPVPNRDALRFLWYQDGNLDGDINTYRMTSHLFGGTWSPACCGFALRYVADKHGPSYSQLASDAIRDNFYVDDCLKALATPEEATAFIQDLRGMLADGGFHVTKFASNSKHVLESVPVEERAKGIRTLNLGADDLPFEKALGLTWDLEEDVLTFIASIKTKPVTRRGMLSGVSSLFDPLGLVSPFSVRGRMLVQELTRLNLGWDEEIPGHIALQWGEWLGELAAVAKFKIERCIKPTGSVEFQLHHFGDASTRAYGSVSYLRATLSDGQFGTFLVMSRSRLAPMKELSIPRLELSAAALTVKMDSMLRRELGLKISHSVFWTDSMVVLGYIRNPMVRYHTFVANRVSAIHAGSEADQWRHVSSAVNPADMISRGMPIQELNQSSLWIHGPEFLREPAENWPGNQVDANAPSSDDPEVKKVFPVLLNANNDPLDEFINHHSSWLVVRKRVALLLRVKSWLRQKVAEKDGPDIQKPVTAAEFGAAEVALVQYVQRKEFPSYFGKDIPVKGSLSPLAPKMNADGLLVVGGRVSKGDLPEKMKHPVILPKDHHLTDLIVRDTHLQNGHVGREHVLSLVREKFWLIRGRLAVRRVLAKCVVCKKWDAKPATQLMGDLPKGRIEGSSPPFANVGIDFFGPIMVKRGRSLQKRYGCLFTCMTVRAIHLEVSFSLDTDSFIHCLHRFMSRRGCPKQIFCDNGTNFVGAEGQLKELLGRLDQGRIHAALVPKGVEWQFIPPSASHMGGAWERLVKSVKRVLNPMLSEQTLEDEGLATLMCIVESILNSRPLTRASEDPRDLEALTPNHLLLPGSCSYVYPDGEFCSQDQYVRRRWRQIQYYADVFWYRWLREYLPLLQTRPKWQVEQRNLQVNDLVLLVEETPRSQWPLAKIIDIYPGEDGRVRKVKIRTRTTELVRPVTKLCVLEEA